MLYDYTIEEILAGWLDSGYIVFDGEIHQYIYTQAGLANIKTDRQFLYNPETQAKEILFQEIQKLHAPGALKNLLDENYDRGYESGLGDGYNQAAHKFAPPEKPNEERPLRFGTLISLTDEDRVHFGFR